MASKTFNTQIKRKKRDISHNWTFDNLMLLNDETFKSLINVDFIPLNLILEEVFV